MLFHISKNGKLEYLTPRIPAVSEGTYEDSVTPRVCFAPSINCCLRAICYDTFPESLSADNFVAENNDLVVSEKSLEKD